jgi:hypothetical protein
MRQILIILLFIVVFGCTQNIEIASPKGALVGIFTHVGGGNNPCDKIFIRGTDRPLPGSIVDFGGDVKLTNTNGGVYYANVPVTTTTTLTVTFPTIFRGATLGPCPNSPTTIQVEPDDYKGANAKWLNLVFWAQRTGIATATPTTILQGD